ncbi:hypothetical protein WA026_002584 [Henosepilachna vigintioctopunctata]|uniref:Uncharacterized protein n=1 Tax=Henosepilachna vigintioctopunctata TaxID=420089 RepID=A0AAW1U1J3_9CUCU
MFSVNNKFNIFIFIAFSVCTDIGLAAVVKDLESIDINNAGDRVDKDMMEMEGRKGPFDLIQGVVDLFNSILSSNPLTAKQPPCHLLILWIIMNHLRVKIRNLLNHLQVIMRNLLIHLQVIMRNLLNQLQVIMRNLMDQLMGMIKKIRNKQIKKLVESRRKLIETLVHHHEVLF